MRRSQLSLADAFRNRPGDEPPGGLHRWIAVVCDAPEPCLMLDRAGLVAACSPPAGDLLGLPDTRAVLGRGLLDGVLEPVDFTGTGDRLSDWERARLPPLRALADGVLSRGLVRFRRDGRLHTVDAISTPLRDEAELAGQITGSLTFLSAL